MTPGRADPPGDRDHVVAVILAVGISTAINLITLGILYDAIVNPGTAGISDNAAQILLTTFGGIIGILGAVFGFRQGASRSAARDTDDSPTQVAPVRTKGQTMSTDTPEPREPRDPATDPDFDIEKTPQDSGEDVADADDTNTPR